MPVYYMALRDDALHVRTHAILANSINMYDFWLLVRLVGIPTLGLRGAFACLQALLAFACATQTPHAWIQIRLYGRVADDQGCRIGAVFGMVPHQSPIMR